MSALPATGELSFSDIVGNRGVAESNVSIKTESLLFASGSRVGDIDGDPSNAGDAADRTAISGSPFSISEFRGADYPSSIITGITFTTEGGGGDTDTVDTEDLDVAFTTDGTAGTYTVRILDGDGNTDATETRSGAGTVTFSNLALDEDEDYYAQVEYDQFNKVNDDATFDHWDQISGGSGGLSYTTRNVDAADESVPAVTVTPTVSTGTQRAYALGSITSLVAGDGGTMAGTYGSGEDSNTATITNVPGKIRFAVTHYGNPTNARNVATSTTDLDITYNRAIDISVNDNTVNSGTAFTITAVSEGLTGAATMRVGYGTSNSNTTYTDSSDKSISGATNYVRNSQAQAFTRNLTSGTSLETFYGKAHYTSGAATITATSAIYIAPAFSYTPTANATINVNQTQALGVSSVVGNNASVGITSSPDKGSGTNSATLTPGTNNRIYTISYAGTANYSQTSNLTRTVTVNPTVSLNLSDDTGGNNNPKLDADGNTIASSTHGISPTLFTVTPTVVGDTVSYAWTTSGFTFTSGGGSTAGQVIFKKDSAGTTSQSLTVSGNSTSATAAVSIVAQTIQKAITGGTKPSTLRAGTTFSVTSISTNYTQNIKLVRDGVVIGAAASVASTMNFSIPSSNDYTNNYDSNNVNTLLTDSDHTSITLNLGTTVLLPPLPVVDNFSATTDTALKRIDLSYDTTHATGVSIDQGVGIQAVDGDITATGLANNTPYTFTLTANNAASETVTDTASATTINPSISFGTPGDTSITYGETGTYTIEITKNFTDAIEVHVGYDLNASETGGTEMQILTGQGSGATTFNATFNRNFFGAASYGSNFSPKNVIDYRAGSSDAGWFHNDTNNTLNDFAAPGVPTSLSTSASSGTAIAVTWSNPGSGQTGVVLYWGETAEGDFPNSTTITNGATSADATGLDHSTNYTFKIIAFITKTTTPLGSSESRTNYSAYSSTVAQSTTGWNSVTLEGDAFSGVVSGTGFSTQEAAATANDETSGQLFYSNTTTLGTNTVALKRTVDGSPFNGGNAWYLLNPNDGNYIVYVEDDGEITAANYIAVGNAKPIAPTSISFSSVTSTSITINWSDNSAIEDGFKVYMNTGGAADSGDTLINTASANATSYTKDSDLSGGTTYYFAVYAYNGSALSDVLQGSQATSAAAISFSPTSITTMQVAEGGNTWSGAIHATIAGGYHGLSGDSTTVAISGDTLGWAINAGEGSDPGTGTSASSQTLSGTDNDVYFRIKVTATGANSFGDTGNATVTITHSATGQSNIVGTFAVDGEVTDA